MAFWGKNGTREKNPVDHSLSIIGEGVRLEGTLDVPGNLRLEGSFQGEVRVGNRMVIAESGQVRGTIQARELLIAGTFDGKIQNCEHIEITGTAKVRGSIHSQRLEVHAGASLHLNCQIGEGEQPPFIASSNGASSSLTAADSQKEAARPPASDSRSRR